jgi:SAM-dependent methyltransferase
MAEYPHIATERFDNAKIWIKYIINIVKPYIGKNVLEIGAGCGSFTSGYRHVIKKLTLTETDNKNLKDLRTIFFNNKNVKIIKSDNIKKINGRFDTIIYFNVLEHIKNDDNEINNSLKKLKKGGHLIILVPAHQNLYGNLDKIAGHYRRYNIKYFDKKFSNSKIVINKYFDSVGYFLYFFNKLFFKKEIYPSEFKIFIWDKIFVPITVIIDFIISYKFGKNILCIYKKI